MKSHLSAVHTGLETPYTPAVPLLCPHPLCFRQKLNGSLFSEEIKKNGEKKRETGKQLPAGLSFAVGGAGGADHQTQLKPSFRLVTAFCASGWILQMEMSDVTFAPVRALPHHLPLKQSCAFGFLCSSTAQKDQTTQMHV